MKPLIFISSVSRELRTARQLVANTLHALGYEPVWQDIFETSSEDLREMLRKKIESCSALLQIVGHAYGAEPPTPDPTFGRCSYTQYEALYARSRKKPVYYLIAEHDLPRDAAAAAIDTPRDESEAAQADAAQRQQLQSDYRQRVLTAEQVYYPVHNHQDTELSVRRLRDDLSKLRRGFRYWMVGITAALVLIAGGVGWNQWIQRKADEHAATFAQKADEAAKKTAADLAEIKDKQEKERLAAEVARQQALKNEQTDQKFAERFLHQLIANKEIKPEEARQRAIKELPALVDLSPEEVLAIIERKLPASTPEAPVSPLERARTALAQGKYDDVFQAADADRAEGRELAILEGTAALAKFRESPQPEWNDRAVAAFGRALALSDKDSKEWTAAANSTAEVFYYLSRYTKAEPLWLESLRILETKYGKESSEVTVVLNNLAQLLSETNRQAEAEPMMRRVLAIDERAEHPNVATDLNNLAQLLNETNRQAEAEPLMRRALAIDEQSYGADHSDVAIRLNNLAQLLQATNRLAESEPLMRRVLAIDEQSYGPEHPQFAIDLNNLALFLIATNRLEKVEPLMRAALAIDEHSYGADHPCAARHLNNLAVFLIATNRLEKAEPLVRRALAIDEHSYGPDHPDVARDINNLAKLFRETNRLADANPLQRRALTIFEHSYGAEHPNVAVNLNNLGQILQTTNHLNEAEPLMRRCRTILHQYQTKNGHEHPRWKLFSDNYRNLLESLKLTPDEIEQRFKEAETTTGPLGPIVPDIDRLLGPAMPVAEVLAALDLQYKAEGKPAVYFLPPDQPISPHLDELLGKSKIDLPLDQPIASQLDRLLGPAKSTQEVFEELDRQYREQKKPPVWFLPLSEPIAPHLDELLGPVPVTPISLPAVGQPTTTPSR